MTAECDTLPIVSASCYPVPAGNGEASTVLQYIQVPYQPGDPVLYSNATSIAPASAGVRPSPTVNRASTAHALNLKP